MAVTKIAYRPDLTREQAMYVFRRQFSGRCDVIPTPPVLRRPEEDMAEPQDFVVRKNVFIGVRVELVQGEGETAFVHSGNVPTVLGGVLVAGTLVPLLFIHFFWKGLEAEVRSLIESAPEFK